MTTRLAVPVRFGVPARFAVPVAVLIVGLSTGTLAGLAGWRRASGAASTIEDVLPAFTEPGEGRRAKDTDGFGLAVGRAHLAEVERFAAERKLTCRDTSARALYRAAHAAKDEGGEAVDAGSSASARSSAVRAMLQNPQIRLSCEGTRGELIGDRPRTASEGRLLFLFDSAAHPLRHVSFRRIHTADARALEDAEETLRALTARFGPPAVTGDLPSDRPVRFAPFSPFKAEWRWADLAVTLSVLSLGSRGIDVYEAVEVPWPVRSDAPGRAAFARGSKE